MKDLVNRVLANGAGLAAREPPRDQDESLASVLLSAKDSYSQAMLAFVLLASMALVEYAWPGTHVHLDGMLPKEMCGNGLYIFAHVAVLSATLFIAVFLTSSIAQEVVRKHGGDIECESQAGATFRFHVPIVEVVSSP